MAYLDVANLRIEYERGVPTIDNYDLSIEEGELVALLGPSGCGKTTTLRAVAGFIEPASGRISVAGKDYTRLPPNKRDISMVFQSYALFPHLSVFDNVAFGLKMRRVASKDITRRTRDALAMVDLAGYEDRRPAQLSGGQQQRVALARAIVVEPSLLLFDEPLSNLDAKLRMTMRTEIRRLQQRLGLTALYVTHDQVEALAISDRVVVMNKGKIEQMGDPETIFTHPATAFVADFMGFANKFAATISARNSDTITVQSEGHTLIIPTHDGSGSRDPVLVYFRPDAAALHGAATDTTLPGDILLRTFQGGVMEYVVATALGEFIIHQPSTAPRYDTGSIHISFDTGKLNLIAP